MLITETSAFLIDLLQIYNRLEKEKIKKIERFIRKVE